jgi:hypothetical protein
MKQAPSENWKCVLLDCNCIAVRDEVHSWHFISQFVYIPVSERSPKTISLPDQHGEIVVSREDNRVAIPLRRPGGKASKARPESPARLELLSYVNNSFFSLNPNCV